MNCLIYAIKKRITEGGSIKVRRSKYSLVLPQFLHRSVDGVYSYYAPLYPKHGLLAFLHKLWFKGKVRTVNKRKERQRRKPWLK